MSNRYFCHKIIGLLSGLLLMLLLFSGCQKEDEWLALETKSEEQHNAEETVMLSDTMMPDQNSAMIQEEIAETFIFIDVEGAVMSPGVYRLKEGDRVFQAILEAGGFTQEAYAEQINQARILNDGEQIYIFTDLEWEEARKKKQEESEDTVADNQKNTLSDSTKDKINLNTADLTAFMSLPGIGEAKARAILTYRENTGSFQTIEDVMKVEGIKEGVFQKIKDYIVVD